MKFQQISLSPEDSQFLQTRQFQISEIARLVGVFDNKIGGNTPNLYQNRESNETTFLQDDILPWTSRIQQEANPLFRNDEQDSYFCEFLFDARLRGDEAARATFYSTLTNIGALVPDEIRDGKT